jgi:hypothetical protein
LLELPDNFEALKSDWKYYVGFSPFVSLSLSLDHQMLQKQTKQGTTIKNGRKIRLEKQQRKT